MRKVVTVVALGILMAAAPTMALAAPKDPGFSCTKTSPAFDRAREGSSGAPSGGFNNGAENSNERPDGGSQVNYCEDNFPNA